MLQSNAQFAVKFSPLSYSSSPVTLAPELFALTSNKNVMWVGAPELANGTTCNYARTTNGGLSFTKSTVPETTNRGITGMAAIDSNTAWVTTTDPTGSPAGNGGAIWKTINGGSTWTKQTTTQFAAPGYVNYIHFFNKDTGIAGGDQNGGYWEIYRTVNGGTTWLRVPQASVPSGPPNETGTYNCFSAIGKNIWFTTTIGRAIYSNDYGITWTAGNISTSGPTGIEMSDAMNGAAWDQAIGNLYLTTNGGATWTPKTITPGGVGWITAARNVPGTYFYKIPGDGYYVTTNNFNTTALISAIPNGNVKGMKALDNTLAWSQSSLKPDSAVVRIVAVSSTGVGRAINVQQLSILPNPVTTDAALVNYNLLKAGHVTISLQDAAGRVVRKQVNESRAGDNATVCDFSGLTTGFYMLSLTDGNSTATLKVIRD